MPISNLIQPIKNECAPSKENLHKSYFTEVSSSYQVNNGLTEKWDYDENHQIRPPLPIEKLQFWPFNLKLLWTINSFRNYNITIQNILYRIALSILQYQQVKHRIHHQNGPPHERLYLATTTRWYIFLNSRRWFCETWWET